jgi:valyl-tRNA synthetase
MTGKQGDFEKFYPTSLMETAYDILVFWVMRMLMMGIYVTGKVPFKDVYLHGLIRDGKGQKMSKSKGNVVNPLDVASQYGADALRMALVIRSNAGRDKNVGDNDFRAMRNLTNKIWNAARFISLKETNDAKTASGDTKYYKKLSTTINEISGQLDRFKIGLAAETVYNRFWHWFCDECIEMNKKEKISDGALIEGLKVFLQLLHPFVPFVTEAVWNEMKEFKNDGSLLMNSPWPLVKKSSAAKRQL